MCLFVWVGLGWVSVEAEITNDHVQKVHRQVMAIKRRKKPSTRTRGEGVRENVQVCVCSHTTAWSAESTGIEKQLGMRNASQTVVGSDKKW